MRGDIKIKEHNVEYLVRILDNTLSGLSMCDKVIGKISGRLNFLYRKPYFFSEIIVFLSKNSVIKMNVF